MGSFDYLTHEYRTDRLYRNISTNYQPNSAKHPRQTNASDTLRQKPEISNNTLIPISMNTYRNTKLK
jgi:hypothetical protein